MRNFLRTILSISLDGFVVLTMIATVGTIATLLPYASVHRRTAHLLSIFIAVAGIAAVFWQMRRLYRADHLRMLLSQLLAEGHQLVLRIGAENPGERNHWREFPAFTVRDQQQYDRMADWCGRVEVALRKYLEESYVTRFHRGGSNEQDATSMTIWKMNHRLETLASFLTEQKG